MIRIKNVYKTFDSKNALRNLSLTIRDGEIFGLVGTNGSGKTTLLKLICGIMKPERGSVLVDGFSVYENIELKEEIFYIADDAYFISGYTCEEMKNFYCAVYPKFNEDKFTELTEQFHLDRSEKITNMSKGMKKQLSVILALSAQTKYVLLDETFDGLDPVMRQAVKSLLAQEICDSEVTVMIASHNLRELEDICEHIGVLHNGSVLVSDDMDSLKETIHKVQCVFDSENEPNVFKTLNISQYTKQGSLHLLTVRGNREAILAALHSENPVFCEVVPLSLEEIFISETEVVGYEVKQKNA